jgi:hypothetical protein
MATTPHTHPRQANNYNTLLQQTSKGRLAQPPAKKGEEAGQRTSEPRHNHTNNTQAPQQHRDYPNRRMVTGGLSMAPDIVVTSGSEASP